MNLFKFFKRKINPPCPECKYHREEESGYYYGRRYCDHPELRRGSINLVTGIDETYAPFCSRNAISPCKERGKYFERKDSE